MRWPVLMGHRRGGLQVAALLACSSLLAGGCRAGNSLSQANPEAGVSDAQEMPDGHADAPAMADRPLPPPRPARDWPAQAAELIGFGATWRYWDRGPAPADWRSPDFDDGPWPSGSAELGYGDGDEATVIGYGPDEAQKHVTAYFRAPFTVADPEKPRSLLIDLVVDDGAVIYLNGRELWRIHMPERPIQHDTLATVAVEGPSEGVPIFAHLPADALRPGRNVLAVEVHQVHPTSSDLSFDLAMAAAPEPAVMRGPYLQMGTPTSAVVRWRTTAAVSSEVRFGTEPGALTRTVQSATTVTEHEVTLTGLTPRTRYFYNVGTAGAILSGGEPTHHFLTLPPPGPPVPTRIWALGDSGTADHNAAAVRDAYTKLAADGRRTDVWLMLGDNAYPVGTDAEYQRAVFDMYPDFLRSTFLWPTIGNHDTAFSADPPANLPYFQIFTLPTRGEAGGLASGTERYYAFDYANIHFICLDSMSSSRAPGSPMLTWLEADLAQNTRDWVIAFWHHPPYSKGSHDSDLEHELVQMREHVLPILERGGVDLVLTGHSHSYERSFLLAGHYGPSTTLTEAMKKDPGSGREGETGPYRKPSRGPASGEGAVYVVAGSSGAAYAVATSTLDHPAMLVTLVRLGSLVVDVDGMRLHARFLRENGEVDDQFTIVKGAGP
jgi:hypothetical protein